MGDCWHTYTENAVASLRSAQRLRSLHTVQPSRNAVQVEVEGCVLNEWLLECGSSAIYDNSQSHPLKLFSLNDYLGLSTHPSVCLAACQAAATGGLGPRSSPLVGGYSSLHRELELKLAALKGTEEALLFPSGYAANQATLATLGAGPDCVIFSDELNHASIIDGIRLAKASGATLRVYRHNDMHHLSKLLSEAPAKKRKLVVTDSLFSMDGDFADLQGLVKLKQRHNFLLVIDEAHATLVCGARGGGAAEMFGVAEDVDVHAGTLSKAIGSQGGFVACSRTMKDLLLSRGRPYIFSTALAAPSVAAASAAIDAAAQEPWRQEHVWALIRRLERGLGVRVDSPIVPVIVGAEADALKAAGDLLSLGYHVPAIRPPTVQPGTCRLRISLSAAHSTEDVDNLIAAIHSSNVTVQSNRELETKVWSKL